MAIGPRELAEARDPGTPERDLTRIARAVLAAGPARKQSEMSAFEWAILTAVAANPNTAPALLFELAPRCTGEVVKNPALFLLLLEDPALLSKVPNSALSAILGHADAPPAWLGLAVQRPDDWIHHVVARSPRTPPDVLARMAGSADARVRVVVAGNPGTPPAVLALLARTEEDSGPTLFALRRAVAGNPSAPIPTLEHLAADRALLPYAAANPSLPEYLFEVLAADEQAPVRAALARQPRLPPRLRRRLSGDPSPEVRRTLARHCADPAVLRSLADNDSTMHRALADNPSTPATVLARLRCAPAARVRRAVEKALSSRAAGAPRTP